SERGGRSDREALTREAAATRTIASAARTEAAGAQAFADDIGKKVLKLDADNDASVKAVAAIRARMAALEYVQNGPTTAPSTAREGTDPTLERYYLTLESTFRGDPARIRDQLRTDYLDFVLRARAEAGDAPCIDVGCGRGEWLDVL